jgi:O-methyltransferase involved in polyketide biosynthesis
MRPGQHSYTAMAAASARAAHTHLYGDVRIFADDFAAALIGLTDHATLRELFEAPHTTMSPARSAAFFALRHRFAEDRLALAIERGVRQLVLLGAGLDTLALRRSDLTERTFSEGVQANSAARGEPWLTYIAPEALPRDLSALGFGAVERLTPALAAERYYEGQPDGVTPLTVWQAVAAIR